MARYGITGALKQLREDDPMPRIAILLGALCVAAAPIISASSTSAQKEADKPADKTDKVDKASKPDSEKADKLDLDKIMSGIKGVIEKELKEEEEEEEDKSKKPTSTPAKK
jgi:hypothetical protein